MAQRCGQRRFQRFFTMPAALVRQVFLADQFEQTPVPGANDIIDHGLHCLPHL